MLWQADKCRHNIVVVHLKQAVIYVNCPCKVYAEQSYSVNRTARARVSPSKPEAKGLQSAVETKPERTRLHKIPVN